MRATGSERGTTLVEMLVVLVIVSLLAVTAIPFAEAAFQRQKELDLRETLRTTRRAIDAFHADWEAGRIAEDAAETSEHGYPVTLQVLVDGLELETGEGERVFRRYLRRLPENPFARPAETDWRLIGYDQRGEGGWNGEDVYDLRPAVRREGLDGSQIADW